MGGPTPKYSNQEGMDKTIRFYDIQVRMYVDSYEADEANQLKNADEMLAPCIDVALQISKLREFTGRDKPNVIT